MNDDKKTKEQLTEELVLLRREISKLKASKAGGSALALYTAKASPSYAATWDMTQRKHSEETLRESERLYRALAESAQDFTFIVDKDGYVNYVNTSTANQFRCRPERMVGKRIHELFPPDTAKQQLEDIQRVCKSGEWSDRECPIMFPGRTLWIDTH
jgi:PAS domain S-box-containing protein